jgi:Spy/CpxP family protein refolding chaperone
MKKNMLLLGLMLVSTIIFAQRKVDPMERAARQTEKLKKELSLDEVQYKAISAINEDYAGKQAAVWRDSSLSKEERRDRMRTLHQEKEAAFNKVLTKEQREKLAAHRSEQLKKHQSRMARRHGNHAERMQKNLSLTDEQTLKIKSIDKEYGEKFRALRNDSTMAKEDLRTKAKLLREEYKDETKSVLTKEQYEKWEAQKADRKKKKF